MSTQNTPQGEFDPEANALGDIELDAFGRLADEIEAGPL
jgi:hypothetical protein